MLQDLQAACRSLIKYRWFTCVTVVTLALGIGANTAIFGVVNRLLLNPLPYPEAERIAYLTVGSQGRFGAVAGFIVRTWREQVRSFDGIEAYELHFPLAYDEGGVRVVNALSVTPGAAALLGISPVLGRSFTHEDATPGAPAVALLSYETWQREFGGVTNVLGRTINLDDAPAPLP